MITLSEFNHLPASQVSQLLAQCVAIPEWVRCLVAGRPYATRQALQSQAVALTKTWGATELAQALTAHPRIGEQPPEDPSGEFSRREQAGVSEADCQMIAALQDANHAYEQRFGWVFLIRAAGRSGPEMLSELARRLHNTFEEEQKEALGQLAEITLLRLEGVMG